MINAGRNIVDSSDRLTKVTLDYLVNQIRNPKPEIEAKIRKLRIVRNIDEKRYRDMKKALPYIVCAIFSPAYRKTENFAYTEYFFMDIDHISQKELNVKDIRDRIIADDRVVVCFTSPSEDGLKILFKLKERCYDHGKYSVFYKNFTKEFSAQYKLEQVVDSKTCDVCRACFISIDKDVYYNPNASTVDLAQYVNMYAPNELYDIPVAKSCSEDKEDGEPENDAVERIKDILKLNREKSIKQPVYVPQQLNDVIDEVKKQLEEAGFLVNEIINISWGKKLKLQLGAKLSEINIFYGKRGFSTVISPRTGTDKDLNELSRELVESILNLL